MLSKRYFAHCVAILAGCAIAACAAPDVELDDSEEGGGSAASQGTAGSGGSGSSFSAAAPDGGGSTTGSDSTCAATTVSATRPPVDIIFAVDQSGSMGGEIAKVKANINTFAQSIGTSGLDYQVIMIAAKSGDLPICVPEPLAGPLCTDNGTKFRAVDRYVGSHSAMAVIVDSYDKTWKQWARPTALKAFVVITDDDSDMTPELFDAALLSKPDGMFGSVGKRNYVYNSICGWKEGDPVPGSAKCPGTAAAGVRHQNASLMTGGIVESVCKSDYGAVLASIAKKVTERLACEFAVPVPSSGQAPDPTTVAVKLSSAGGASKLLTQVTDASKCAQVTDAWHYDDNAKPTRIVLCASTCNAAASLGGAKVDAQVGCKVPPPR